MNAIEILALSVSYVAIGTVCGRLVAGHLAWTWYETNYYGNGRRNRPSGDQWLGASALGACCVLVWPVVLLLGRGHFKRFAIGAEARAISAERNKRITERDKRIKDLERELRLQ